MKENIFETIKTDINSCPQITINPKDTTTCEGNSVVLRSGAISNYPSENSDLNYSWQVNKGNGWTNLAENNYSGQASPLLRISNIPLSFNNYKYRCIVSNQCTSTSLSATLTVTPFASVSIYSESSANICQGTSIILKTKNEQLITKTELNYQWLQNGTAIDGAINSNFFASESGSYSLMINDNNGCSKISDTVKVSVHYPPKAVIYSAAATGFCHGDSVELYADTDNYENFESNDFTSYSWIQGGDSPWKISGSVFYNGKYSTTAIDGALQAKKSSTLLALALPYLIDDWGWPKTEAAFLAEYLIRQLPADQKANYQNMVYYDAATDKFVWSPVSL